MMEKIKIPDVEHDECKEHLSQYDWMSVDIGPRMLDVTERYNRPIYTLEYNGVPFAPLGGILALTGKSGNGKTMSFTLMMAALLGGEIDGLKCCLPEDMPRTVLYVDTEMEHGNTLLVNNRVYSMLGWQFGVPHEEFKVLCLREVTQAVDRWRMILKALYEIRPTVVFIDGLLDIVTDFNDNSQCQNLIYECMATASVYKSSLWCLVHENPNSTKMVGHLGSMLDRKATDVFQTKKDKQGESVTFTITQIKARGRDVSNILFVVEDGPSNLGEPHIISPGTLHNAGRNNALQLPEEVDWPALMRKIISNQFGITKTDLIRNIKRNAKVGQANAYKVLDSLEQENIIIKDRMGKYHIGHGAVQNEIFNQENNECPY